MPIVNARNVALARQAPDVDLSIEKLDEIASLALAITHHKQRQSGIPTEPIHARPYEDRTSQERAAMRAGALRVIQAMILLGWIDMPAVSLPPAG